MRRCFAAWTWILIAVGPAFGQRIAPVADARRGIVPDDPLVAFLAHSPASAFVLFSPDGKRIVSGGSDNLVQVWDLHTGKLERTLFGHDYWLKCGALSADGKVLVTGSWDKTVRVWDVDSGTAKKVLKGHTAPVDSVVIVPHGNAIASAGSDRVFRLWNMESGEAISTSPLQDLAVNRIAVSPDGKLLATGTGDVNNWRRAGEVKLWNAASGEEIAVLPGHSACVGAVVFSPDGKRLATATANGILRIWDVAKRQELSATSFGYGVRTVAFFADGQTLAIGRWPGLIFLMDVESCTIETKYVGHRTADAMVDRVALSPDQSVLASTGTDGMIYLWPVPESTIDGSRTLWKKLPGSKQLTGSQILDWKPPDASANPNAEGKN